METYAIIKTGGKQYRVKKGDIIDVEVIEGQPGDEIHFKEILFVSSDAKSHAGKAAAHHFAVTAKFLSRSKGPKISCMKYHPGNRYRKFGHRQPYARCEITAVEAKGKGGKHGS